MELNIEFTQVVWQVFSVFIVTLAMILHLENESKHKTKLALTQLKH
jgi:hypothetical protein